MTTLAVPPFPIGVSGSSPGITPVMAELSPMATAALPRLPDDQLAALAAAYDAATRAKRTRSLTLAVAIVALAILSGWVVEVDLPNLFGHLGTFFSYFDRILTFDSGPGTGQRVWTDPAEWYWGLWKWLRLLGDTLLIAYLGTMLGAVAGFLLCFSASQNLMPKAGIRLPVKRFLELCRTVPEIVFALIFVIAFGLGPIPGVLAIAIHTTGALGKLFSEVVENIDMKPFEGATSTGATWPETIRFAVVPQVLSNFASYSLLRFEINVRGASVMGFVGRRHWAGPHRGNSQILLRRRLGDPAPPHRLGLDYRHRDRAAAPSPYRAGGVAMTAALREAALAARPGLLARHPAIFSPPLRHRLSGVAVVLGLVGLAIFGFWRLEFSFVRFFNGLG